MREPNASAYSAGIRVMAIPVLCTLAGALIGATAGFVGSIEPTAPWGDVLAQRASDWHILHAYAGTWLGGFMGMGLSVLALPVRRRVNVIRCILLTAVGMELAVLMIVRRHLVLPFAENLSGIALVAAMTIALFYSLVFVDLRWRERAQTNARLRR